MDFYTEIKRSEFAFINEVGAKPFLLFKYYLTWSTAEEIRPSLETIARDMGMVKNGKLQTSAVCNLNKILVDKKWISINKGVVTILKEFRNSEQNSEKVNESFRNSEQNSENLNGNSEILNEDSENLNGTELAKIGSLNEKKQEKKQREEEPAPTRERIGKLSGFRVNPNLSDFANSCLAGMKKRLKSPHTLPNQFEWLKRFELWELNESTPENFLETYDLLEKIRKKKKGAWTVTFETVEKNFGKIESLRLEVETLENGELNVIQRNKSAHERRAESKRAEITEIESIRARVQQRRQAKLSGSGLNSD